MSQLQKLLDKKFPIYDAMPFHELKKTKLKREAFAEGYNTLLPLVKSLAAALSYAGDTGIVNYDLLEEVADLIDKQNNNG